MNAPRLAFNYYIKNEACGGTTYACNFCFFSSPKFEFLVKHFKDFHFSVKIEKIYFDLAPNKTNDDLCEWKGTTFTHSYLSYSLLNLSKLCLERSNGGLEFTFLKASCKPLNLAVFYCPLCERKSRHGENLYNHIFRRHVQFMPRLTRSRYYITMP
jgi:hypothetical protein